MDREQLLFLLMASAYELWSSTLIGTPAPSTLAMGLVLKKPAPGDLVMEITTFRRKPDISQFGRLVKVQDEPVEFDNEEEKELNKGAAPIRWWYVEDIDGNVHRWTNCKFIRVLEEPINPIDEARKRGIDAIPGQTNY